MRYTCLLIGVMLAGAALAQEPSLGDVARQQKSGSHTRARRVVDNDTLPKASPAEAMNGSVVVPKPPDSKSADSKSEEKPADAKQASPQAATPGDAQKKLDELKATEEAHARALKKFEEALKDESVSADRRQIFEEGRDNAKQLLDAISQERAKFERAVAAAAEAEGSTPAKTSDGAAAPANEKAGDAKSQNKDGN